MIIRNVQNLLVGNDYIKTSKKLRWRLCNASLRSIFHSEAVAQIVSYAFINDNSFYMPIHLFSDFPSICSTVHLHWCLKATILCNCLKLKRYDANFSSVPGTNFKGKDNIISTKHRKLYLWYHYFFILKFTVNCRIWQRFFNTLWLANFIIFHQSETAALYNCEIISIAKVYAVFHTWAGSYKNVYKKTK